MILYIHGFRSSSQARKGQILKKHFENVLTPTLLISPLEAVDFLDDIIAKNKIDLIIGSSLGGFYGFYCLKNYKIPTILINPSLKPWETLEKQIGKHTKLNSKETFEWTKEHNNELKLINEQTDKKTSQKLLDLFISTDDDILDHSNIDKQFPEVKIKYYNNSGHSFTRFEEILPFIESKIQK